MTLILASASPRRSELLERAGIAFEVCPSNADESSVKAQTAEGLCRKRARLKAQSTLENLKVGAEGGGFVVLGADTVVEKDGIIYGKPKDEKDAQRMLHKLSGASHSVYTAVTLIDANASTGCETVEKTTVTFKAYDKELIDGYIASGLWRGKAGGYGIQDDELKPLVEKIDGETDNVIGLPVKAVLKMLKEKAKWLHWK